MSIQLKEKIPGINEAKDITERLKRAGIEDVRLFYDKTIQPHGMWAVCQVQRETGRILMPGSYGQENIRPLILWWCKTRESTFRIPNENDFHDMMVVAKRAEKIWAAGGNKLDDEFIKQDKQKEEAHRKKQRDRIHAIAPDMKRAIRRELT